MWYRVDSMTGSAAAAVICSLVVRSLTSREAEVGSDIVCWVLLPVLFVSWEVRWAHTRSQRPIHDARGSRISLWLVAGGIAAACLYRAELDREGLFVSNYRSQQNLHD